MTQLPRHLVDRRVLHLGSGTKYTDNAVNVDLVARTNPDIVHDLDVVPWPLPENHFVEVRAFDVIEHLDDIVAAMEQIHRVCVDGASVLITVPHFSSVNAHTDITHRHNFSSRSFDYFTEANEFAFYTSKRFMPVKSTIIFAPTLLNKIVWRAAARWPGEYERRWAWLFPAWFLSFELQVIKTGG